MLPSLATADEQGLSGFDAPGWYALVLPMGAPEAVVHSLNDAMSKTFLTTRGGGGATHPTWEYDRTVGPADARIPIFIHSERDQEMGWSN